MSEAERLAEYLGFEVVYLDGFAYIQEQGEHGPEINRNANLEERTMWTDLVRLSAELEDARTEATALRVTEENLLAELEALKKAHGVPDGFIQWLEARASDSYSCSVLVKDALARLASAPPAPQANPLSDEHDYELCEAYCNAASDEYFKARPQLDSSVNRRIFYAGHRKAWIEWQAAHGIKE